MIGKLFVFLPQIIIVASIALASLYISKKKIKPYEKQTNSVDWVEENSGKLFLSWAFMAAFWAPTAEELIFRLPLLIAFDRFSTTAWIFIALQALLFGLVHDKKKDADMKQIFRKRGTGEATDNLEEEMALHQKKNPVSLRVAGVTARTILGLIAGYLTIRYQSVLPAVGLHFAWNVLLTPIIILIMIIPSVIYYLFLTVQLKIELYQYRRRMRKALTGVGRMFYPYD